MDPQITKRTVVKTKPPANGSRILVAVFEDLESAANAVSALKEAGIPEDRMELVVRDVREELPELHVDTNRETAESSLIEDAEKWGSLYMGAGAAVGLIYSLLAPFPGVVLGMMYLGGVSGAIMGGMAGLDRAAADDSINLPGLEEYQQLLANGHKLLVVHGTHEEVHGAKELILQRPHVASHLYVVRGHRFHEHAEES
jgi:hypothetical protein